MEKILVPYRVPREGFRKLEERYALIYPKEGWLLTREEQMAAVPECSAIVATSGIKVDEEMLHRAKKLKIVTAYGAGYDNVDVEAARKLGIPVTNIPHTVTEATAELAMTLMLAVCRQVVLWDRLVREDQETYWRRKDLLGTTLYGKQLGIVGMGRIGRALARRARAFGMAVVYHNRHRLDREDGARYMELEELLRTSDVVSLNLPLTDDSRGLIGERAFHLMKSTAYLINVARGAVVDEEALIRALKAGRIAGAGLDVFVHEPGIPEELLGLDNVVLTGHIGSDTLDTRNTMAAECSFQILDALSGRMPQGIVNG